MTDSQSDSIVGNLAVALQLLKKSLEPLTEAMAGLSQAIAPYMQAMAPYIKYFVRYHKFIESVRPTGWLPYHTVSIDFVEECGDDVALLDERLTSFYENNWEAIRRDIEARLDQYHISEDAKATFREALSAHSAGYYRCVCRVLFPEIEREFRIHFFEDKTGRISSKKMLEQLNNRGKLVDLLPREAYGWILLGRLIRHLYEEVNDSNRAEYEKDCVPNRHAAAHGLLPYATHKHSMNMIIMADYVFQILTALPAPSLRP